MPVSTDPTGAWIDHLAGVEGPKRLERLSCMTALEKDAVLLRLLEQRGRSRARVQALLDRVDVALVELATAGNDLQEALDPEALKKLGGDGG